MHSNSLCSIQDPYRNRCSTKVILLAGKPRFQPEPGRTHSYLPYTNHAPDFIQSRATLYVEDDDTHTITSNVQVDLVEQHNEPTVLYNTGPISHIVLPKKKQTSRKKLWACSIIVFFVVLVVIAYFCWPRIPRLVIQNEKAERVGDPVDWGPRHQPWLKAAWQLNVTFDNHMNYVPTRIQEIQVILKDRDTLQPFAWSSTKSMQLMPYQNTIIPMVFQVAYTPLDINDTTFRNLYNACGPQMPTESPALNVTVQAIICVSGLLWPFILHVPSSDIGGLSCPSN